MRLRRPGPQASPLSPHPLTLLPPPHMTGPDGRYILIRKIGSGSFGQIYEGIAADTQLKVAIKLELATSKHPQVRGPATAFHACQCLYSTQRPVLLCS